MSGPGCACASGWQGCHKRPAHRPGSTRPAAAARLRWYTSPPFDIGSTTTQALRWAGKGLGHDGESPAQLCTRHSGAHNQESKSNGALMRATPLAVWGHAAPAHKLALWAAQDARWVRLGARPCGQRPTATPEQGVRQPRPPPQPVPPRAAG
jgi:hypothetical protein